MQIENNNKDNRKFKRFHQLFKIICHKIELILSCIQCHIDRSSHKEYLVMTNANNLENEEINLPDEQEDKKRKSAMPAFIISAVVHSLLILITFLMIVSVSKPKQEDIIITTSITEEIEEPINSEEKRDVVKNPVEVTVTTEVQAVPMVTTEETTDHNETDNNMEAETAEGTSEGITDSPQVGSGLMGNIGGGGGGGGTFGTRSGGGKKRALMKGGGSAKTESSVDAALRWLMRHQEKDGSWDGVKYGATTEAALGNGFNYSQVTALTGLSTLAFLSAGHTPKIGKYKNTVKTAVEWILAKQEPDGTFGKGGKHIYEDAICALALAETYGMYPDPKIKVAAQKAIDYLVNPNPSIHWGLSNDKIPYSNSVLGWVLMAFKSAKIAGLNVPDDIWAKYKAHMELATSKDQSGNYDHVKYSIPGGLMADANKNDNTMTAIGMLMFEYLGVKRVELDVMADRLIKDLPAWGAPINDSSWGVDNFDFYHWYYATLALFQFGGEHWKKWNKALSNTLVTNQRKGGPLDGSLQDTDGSWDPIDQWGRKQGRVYTTAMGAFCLEVYYRYESVTR